VRASGFALRFLRQRLGLAAAGVLVLVGVGAVVGESLWRYDYADISSDLYLSPSAAHPLGTDNGGHDVLAQVLRGVQRSLTIAVLVAVLSTLLGVAVGATAGYFGGTVDSVLMRMTDLILTVPTIVVLVVVAGSVQKRSGSWALLALLLASLSWARKARLVRASFRTLRERQFVEAARAAGAGAGRIICRHLLPSAAAPVSVAATLTVATAVLAETSLAYLGLGPPPPDTSLGQLVQAGQDSATTHPWLFYFPALAIVVIVLSVNLVGEALRRAFDPTDVPISPD
jgi:ABC-type dipeptide/oligopeptide/nickel transport system permease subunit